MRFIKEIKKYWKFALYSARADLRAEVANSYLNWMWWILEPVSSMLIYTLVFGVVFTTDEMYFPIFVFSAITMWDFFNRCMVSGVDLIRNNQHIISKVFIPKHILLLQRMLVLAFKMLICWGIVIVMMICYRVPVGINVLYFFPTLLVFFVFCFACGTYMLHFGVYISDLSNVVNIVLKLMFYVTGVFYTVESKIPAPYGYFFQRINPVAYLIFCMRKTVIYNERPSVLMLGVWFLISVLLAFGGIKLIYKNENDYVKVI